MFSIRKTLAWSYAAFKVHFKALASISVLNLIPFAIIELLPEEGIGAQVVSALLSLVSVFVSYLVMAAMYHIATVAVSGGDPSRDAIIARVKSVFVPMLVVSAISMLFTFAWLPTILGIFVASIFVSLAIPVLFVEGKKGIDAVATSITLIKGRFWKFVLYSLVSGLGVLVPLLLVTFGIAAIDPMPGESISLAGNLIINGFTYVFVVPVITMISFGAYRSLRAITPEPEEAVYAKRRRFVKIGAIVGPIILAVLAAVAVLVIAVGSFAP